MSNLSFFRRELASIDQKLLELFLQRMKIVDQIADYKRIENAPVFVPEQEHKVIKKALSQTPPEFLAYSTRLMRTLIRLSRERQYERLNDPACFIRQIELEKSRLASVASMAIPASLGASSAKKLQKQYNAAVLVEVEDIKNTCKHVKEGLIDLAILPASAEIYFLLQEYGLFIQGKLILSKQPFIIVACSSNIPFDANQVSLLISRKTSKLKRDFSLEDSLSLVIDILTDLDLEIVKIETLKNHSFYLEFTGEINNQNAQRALFQIKQEISDITFLGWYA